MAVFSKEFLSGSTNGEPIKLATSITTIHTADATAKDEVYVWIHNTETTDYKVTLSIDFATDSDYIIEKVIPAEDGLVLMIPGLPVTGSKLVRGLTAGTTLKMLAYGYVNRIT